MTEKSGPEITVFDVARQAQVSIATVSKVLNRRGSGLPISTETRKRVLEAARSLNYRPNFMARSLRSRRTHTIGLVVADVRHPFYSEMIGGAEQGALEGGFMCILSSAQNKSERERFCLDLFLQNRVEGVLVAGETESQEDEGIRELAERNVPVVLVAREFPDDRIAQVYLDNVRGGRLATEHLLKLRHRRIGYLGGPSEKHDNVQRLAGYREALAQVGVTFESDLITAGDIHTADGYREAKALLGRRPELTALFCYNDTKAFGAIKAIHELGRTVPDAVSVVGFDDIEFCEYFSPPLTTIRQPRFQIGYQGAKILLQLIEKSPAPAERRVALAPELIERQSTGPVRKESVS